MNDRSTQTAETPPLVTHSDIDRLRSTAIECRTRAAELDRWGSPVLAAMARRDALVCEKLAAMNEPHAR